MEEKKARVWLWILVIVIVIILALGLFVYFSLFPISFGPKEKIDLSGITEINSSSVRLILLGIGAGELHKNPLTGSKPVLCVISDNKSYSAVVDHGLSVNEGNCGKPDLTIVISSKELLNIVSKSNIDSALKDSLASGRSQLIVGSSQTDLAAKGYISLYNKISK